MDLEELRELGSGTFGTVYHGKWRGTDVAIKRINDRCFAGKPSEQERMVRLLVSLINNLVHKFSMFDFWNDELNASRLLFMELSFLVSLIAFGYFILLWFPICLIRGMTFGMRRSS